MIITSYNEMARTYGNDRWKGLLKSHGDFQSKISGQRTGTRVKNKNSVQIQNKKNEILQKFSGLTEEKLDELVNDYDIENMDSEELFRLAARLGEEGVIPFPQQKEGLIRTAVYPAALYHDFLKGESYMANSTVEEAYSGCFTTDPVTGEMDFHFPKQGIECLEYDSWLMQQAFKAYNSYYTDEERARQIQLANSKAGFLELAKLLASYKEELSK